MGFHRSRSWIIYIIPVSAISTDQLRALATRPAGALFCFCFLCWFVYKKEKKKNFAKTSQPLTKSLRSPLFTSVLSREGFLQPLINLSQTSQEPLMENITGNTHFSGIYIWKANEGFMRGWWEVWQTPHAWESLYTKAFQEISWGVEGFWRKTLVFLFETKLCNTQNYEFVLQMQISPCFLRETAG